MAYAETMLPQRRGAIAPYVYSLSKQLSSFSNVDVVGLGVGQENEGPFQVHTFECNPYIFESIRKILGRQLCFHMLSNSYFIRYIYGINRRLPIDIYHVHDVYAASSVAIVKRIFRIPSVISLHNNLRNVAPLRVFDNIFTVSEYLKKDVISKGINPSKINVLPPAVDLNTMKPQLDKDSAKKLLGLEKRKIVLFVGRKCHEKGPELVIDSLPKLIAEFPKITAVFIGPDYAFESNSQTFTGFLLDRAKKLGVAGNVLFLGFVPDELLNYYYTAADIFVFPSIWQEPFGLSLVQAMAFGKPSIASNVGGIPEIVQDHYNGLLIKPDASELGVAAIELLSDSDLAMDLSSNAVKTVGDKFSYDVVARHCFDLYKQII